MRSPAAVAVLLAAGTLAVATPAQADSIRDAEYWLDDYGIRTAWNTTQGAGVTIAIIDTGVDGTVPELQGAVVGGTDFSGLGSADGQTPVGSQNNEHGTMVASLAAGRGSGGENGVIGSAPEAAPRHLDRVRRGHDAVRTTRSPRPCGGRSTTAPT